MKAVKGLRQDKTQVTLTADKGVAIVLLDRANYINKAEKLLEEGLTYKKIVTDLINRYKNRLINLLKWFMAEGGINDTLYKMYPTGACAPKCYGLPKCMRDIPLRLSLQQGHNYI